MGGHFQYGSVTERVLKESRVPVTTVPKNREKILSPWKIRFELERPELIVKPNLLP